MRARRPSKGRTPAPPVPTIFRWDLDKTYLRSEFDSLRDLVRISFEKPEDKVAVPGVVPLIRGLREVATQAGREVRIYFISASPPQIAKAIREKLALDGIEYDGLVFKNQLQHLVRGKFRNLREHVGFKLTEILKSRRAMPPDSRELLFGDDWESDPIIYSLYADVLARRIPPSELGDILQTIGVDPVLIAEAKNLAADLGPAEVVTKIYINLERRTPPANFRLFGPRLIPTFNYFQTATCLYEEGHLTVSAVARVAESLITTSGYSPHRLANSLADIIRRGHLSQTTAIAVGEHLRSRGLLPRVLRGGRMAALWRGLRYWLQATPVPPPAAREAINYRAVVAEWRAVR